MRSCNGVRQAFSMARMNMSANAVLSSEIGRIMPKKSEMCENTEMGRVP